MTREEAQATVNRYRCTRAQASASEYMAYMRARGVLDSLKIETLSAGQRGFLAAAAKPMTGGVVTA